MSDASERISVIVPVYKVEPYLDRCVQSIVDQSYTNLEIILVDDGSPDNCPAMCDAWAEKDSRIRVIHKENGGGGAARNTALDIATGNMISFVDSDDYIAPWMFTELYQLLDKGADIAECGYATVFDDSFSFPLCEYQAEYYHTDEAVRLHVKNEAFQQVIWNKLYKKATIASVRFPVGTAIDDEFFTYQVIGNARNLAHIDLVCYAYRQQGDSITHSLNIRKRMQALDAKLIRHEYIMEQHPDIANISLINIWFSCLYLGQLTQKETEADDRECIIRELTKQMKKYGKPKGRTLKEKMWLLLANYSFLRTCALRNLLKIGL